MPKAESNIFHQNEGVRHLSRIVFIAPYRDLAVLTQRIAQELSIDIEIYEGSMEEAGDIIRQLSGPEADVFISRGGTAAYIASHFETPVITVNTGPFDIIECCEEARQYSRNIGLTSFGKPFTGMDILEKVMDITITSVVFNSLPELERKIAALAEAGNYCIVGGGPSVTYAQKYGLPSVFLRTSQETIRDALLRAAELARLRRAEKHKAYRLKTILDSVYDGIIAVDELGKIEIFNKAAERILGLRADAAVGRDAAEVITTTRLNEVLKTGQPEIGEIQQVGDVRIVTSRVPVKDGTDIVGAVATFQDVSRVVQAERRVRKELVGREFRTRFTFNDIIGQSPVIQERKKLAQSFARSDLTVLIYGPSGTGKELFAQSIHRASRRGANPFVAINCAALPPTLLESELFGYEEGAFTGAKRKGKHGLFELAHGGTIFLDEVDALPLDLQGRLLRVLQEREVLRVGGENIIPVDIRVIAATNKPPRKLLAEHKIREDLFYRLNVLYLELPALAERKEDIPLLCRHFLPAKTYAAVAPLLNNMMDVLFQYSWPGNIRELYNFTQRLAFFQADGQTAEADWRLLLQSIAPNILEEVSAGTKASVNLRQQIAQQEKNLILETIKTTGSVEKAAVALGIGRSTLWRKLKKLREEQKSGVE